MDVRVGVYRQRIDSGGEALLTAAPTLTPSTPAQWLRLLEQQAADREAVQRRYRHLFEAALTEFGRLLETSAGLPPAGSHAIYVRELTAAVEITGLDDATAARRWADVLLSDFLDRSDRGEVTITPLYERPEFPNDEAFIVAFIEAALDRQLAERWWFLDVLPDAADLPPGRVAMDLLARYPEPVREAAFARLIARRRIDELLDLFQGPELSEFAVLHLSVLDALGYASPAVDDLLDRYGATAFRLTLEMAPPGDLFFGKNVLFWVDAQNVPADRALWYEWQFHPEGGAEPMRLTWPSPVAQSFPMGLGVYHRLRSASVTGGRMVVRVEVQPARQGRRWTRDPNAPAHVLERPVRMAADPELPDFVIYADTAERLLATGEEITFRLLFETPLVDLDQLLAQNVEWVEAGPRPGSHGEAYERRDIIPRSELFSLVWEVTGPGDFRTTSADYPLKIKFPRPGLYRLAVRELRVYGLRGAKDNTPRRREGFGMPEAPDSYEILSPEEKGRRLLHEMVSAPPGPDQVFFERPEAQFAALEAQIRQVQAAAAAAPDEDTREYYEDTAERLQEILEHFREHITAGMVQLPAVLILQEGGQSIPLRIFGGWTWDADDEEWVFTFRDLTSQRYGEYSGSDPDRTLAYLNAHRDWVVHNPYPRGRVVYEVRIPGVGVVDRGSFFTYESNWRVAREWRDKIIGVGALVVGGLLLIVPEATVTKVAGVALLSAGLAAGIDNIYTRLTHGGTFFEKETLLEFIGIVALLIGGAGAGLRAIRALRTVVAVQRASTVLITTSTLTDFGSVLYVSADLFVEMQRIHRNPSLSQQEKQAQTARLMSVFLVQGLMAVVSGRDVVNVARGEFRAFGATREERLATLRAAGVEYRTDVVPFSALGEVEAPGLAQRIRARWQRLIERVRRRAPGRMPDEDLSIHRELDNVLIVQDRPVGYTVDDVLRAMKDGTPESQRVAELIERGELHVILSTERFRPNERGTQLGREAWVEFRATAEETASTLTHEGWHFVQPQLRHESQLTAEGLARAIEYDFRMARGLGPKDAVESLYRAAHARQLGGEGGLGRFLGGLIPEDTRQLTAFLQHLGYAGDLPDALGRYLRDFPGDRALLRALSAIGYTGRPPAAGAPERASEPEGRAGAPEPLPERLPRQRDEDVPLEERAAELAGISRDEASERLRGIGREELEAYVTRYPAYRREARQAGKRPLDFIRYARIRHHWTRGRNQFQVEVLEALGLPENQAVFRDAPGGDRFRLADPETGEVIPLDRGTIVDVDQPGFMIEIKDVTEQSLERQLLLQVLQGLNQGKTFYLVVSPRTRHLSGPLRAAIHLSGGGVFVFDRRRRGFRHHPEMAPLRDLGQLSGAQHAATVAGLPVAELRRRLPGLSDDALDDFARQYTRYRSEAGADALDFVDWVRGRTGGHPH